MLNPTLSYLSSNSRATRTPVYTVEFDGNPTVYSTHWLFDYFTEVMADAPSLYLRFGEASGATAEDSSGNALDGTYHNSPTLGIDGSLVGDENTAVTFNGTTQYVTVPDAALLDPGDVFTLASWVFIPSGIPFLAFYTIFSKGTNGYYVNIDFTGTIHFGKQGVAEITQSTGAAGLVSIGAWHHIVITKDGSAVHIYLNGRDVTGSVSNQTIAATATDLNIGRQSDNTLYLQGTLDELLIYPTALPASRVRTHYEAGLGLKKLPDVFECMQLPRGLGAQIEPDRGRSSVGSLVLPLVDRSAYELEVAADAPSIYLRFGEASGTTAEDSSGNNLDGAYQSSPTLGVAGALTGNADTAAQFLQSSSQYASVPDNALLDPGDVFTIEFWINHFSGGGSTRGYVSKGTDGYEVRETSGKIQLLKEGTGVIAASTTVTSNNTWFHVVITKTGATIHIYVNGADVTDLASISNSTILATASALRVGASSSGSGAYANGFFDEFALYPTVLSAARVLAHYRSGKENIGGAITRLVADDLGGTRATFKAGFADLCYSDFTFASWVVDRIALNSTLTGYDITLRDANILANKKAFNVASAALYASIGSGDTSLQLVDAGGFSDSGYGFIDDELISWTGLVATGRPPVNGDWTSLVFGNEFVSAEGNATGVGPIAIRTVNGKDWSSSLDDATLNVSNGGIAFAPTLGTVGRYCIAGAITGPGGVFSISDDGGITWSTVFTLATAFISDVWAPTLNSGNGFFVAVGINCAATSPDGITWTARTIPAGTYRRVAWSTAETMLVAVGDGVVATSPDGITWTTRTPGEANNWYSVWRTTIAGGRWVAVAINGTHRVMYSDNSGVTWSTATAAEANIWRDVLQMASGTVIAVSQDGTHRIMRSTDCITWTTATSAEQQAYTALATNGTRVVATGSLDSGYTVAATMYSDDDGITWYASRSAMTGLTRGVDLIDVATSAASHAAGAALKEVLHIGPAHPMDILKDLYENTDKTGVSIEFALVDETGIDAVKASLGSSYQMEFLIGAPENAKQWSEEQIFSILGLYPKTAGGKLSVHEIAIPGGYDDTIDHDSIVQFNSPPWDDNEQSIINYITVEYDYSLLQGNFLTTSAPYIDQDSIDRYGQRPLILQSKGLRGSLAGSTDFIAARAAALLARYAFGAPMVRLRTLLKKNMLEPGDTVSLTSALLPDMDTGMRGVTAKNHEVISRELVFADGYVDLELMEVG